MAGAGTHQSLLPAVDLVTAHDPSYEAAEFDLDVELDRADENG